MRIFWWSGNISGPMSGDSGFEFVLKTASPLDFGGDSDAFENLMS